MLNWLTNIYRQVTVILESNSVSPKDYQVDQWDSKVPSDSVSTGVINIPEAQVLRWLIPSTGIVGRSEVIQDYLELGEALSEMVELEEDDEWRIDEPVYENARRIAAELMMTTPYPAPRIFNHGSKSVVFNWSYGTDNLYLTISSNRISALSSSAERIERRIDQPINQLPNPALFLSSIQPGHLGQAIALIKAASDDPLELLD